MSHRSATFLLLAGLLAVPLVGHCQTKPTPRMLTPGRAVTQRLQGGQAYDYLVALKAGQALKATVVQQGTDVVVTAYDPSGTELASFDSPTGPTEQEVVTVVAATTGRYRLSVKSWEAKAPAGTFMLTLTGILTPAQYAQSLVEDRQHADAVAAYLRAPHPDQPPPTSNSPSCCSCTPAC